MQHLEGSGTPVLYIQDARFLKVNYIGKFIGGIVNVLNDVQVLFENISNLFAFDITFKIMLGSLITLAMVGLTL